MVFGPDALLDHGGNYRHGHLAEGGDYVSAGATNAGRLTGGEIALARGWLQSETKRLVFHLAALLESARTLLAPGGVPPRCGGVTPQSASYRYRACTTR